MERKIVTLIVGLVLIAVQAFAQDVVVDSSGNIVTGASNTNANLEVIGSSGEEGVVGETSGTASGVYGLNTSSGNFGTLGHLNYGVYGKGVIGSAGFFDGNVNILGNLTLTGSISGAGVGDITQVSAGTGLIGGGTSGSVALGVNFGGTGSASTVSRSDHNHDAQYTPFGHTHSASEIVSGTLDIARLNVGTTAGTVAAGDHTHPGLGGARYGGVATVATSGGDYTDPVTAMAAVNTWCGGVPSAVNPCLLRIMPGVYNIGSGTLQMVSYVDIEGSGEKVTRITGNRAESSLDPYFSPFSSALVIGADNAEIRFLTMENTNTTINTSTITMMNLGTSPKMTNVTAIASGGNNTYAYGIYNKSSSTSINSVTVDAQGANGVGVFNDSTCAIEVNNSKLKGPLYSVSATPGARTLIASTKLDGYVTAPSGIIKCYGAYDANFDVVTCPGQ